MDRRNLQAMLCLRKRVDEQWAVFIKRQHRFLRTFMGRIGVMELAAKLLAKQHGWAGHVTRLSQQHVAWGWSRVGTLEDWHLKQAVHTHVDPRNTTSWRHKATGPKAHWEGNLVLVFGDQW